MHLDFTVNTLFVHFSNFQLSFSIHWLKDLLFVLIERLLLDKGSDFWILGENFIPNELSCQGESFDIDIDGHVNELTLRLIDNVVITDAELLLVVVRLRSRLELFCNHILIIDVPIGDETKADSNDAFSDEVHLDNLLLFVVNNLVFVM